ncbi:hypothetical protein ENUP19_0121G0048 [Entamoeba nuttalli]|uniref:Leucine rich repeat-containing protein n=2 Tax=Entamoeba nuttalli TaxID=412467 RepID=K2H9Z8_ENTNP|nr:leucine rich repeat-containing protein [Entamoeba nuttalli P19]EKE39419.1 leucine rich repeat-containing protein [Entamoeba nuttalli P19]|eukprot:XP_008858239.1 leucine rich repeat-containing protein [Entamoeba nuttalli P19]
MGNQPSESLSFQWQSRLTRSRSSLITKPGQLPRFILIKIIPYLKNISNVLHFGAVSKKCAAAIIFTTINPFFSSETLISELKLFSGIKVIRTDISNALNLSLPQDKLLEIKMSYHEIEGEISWKKITNGIVSLELQLFKEIEIDFKSYKELQKVKFIFWDDLNEKYCEKFIESIIYCENLKECIIEVDEHLLNIMKYGINQLINKGVIVILKIHNAKQVLFEIKNNPNLHLCAYSNELHKSIIDGSTILLPDDKRLELNVSLASCESSLHKVIDAYYPTSIFIRGNTAIPNNSNKSFSKRTLDNSSSSPIIQSLDLSPFSCLEQVTLEGIKIVNQKHFLLPTSLTYLSLCDCEDVKSIIIPSSLVQLNCSNCTSLSSFQTSTDPKLKILQIDHCNSIKFIHCPNSVNQIEIKYCTSLCDLDYNKNVESIEIHNCYLLKQIKPAQLTKLVLCGCSISNLTDLLHCSLKELKINTSNIPKTLAIPTTLTKLDLQNCDGLCEIDNLNKCNCLSTKTKEKYLRLSKSSLKKRKSGVNFL